MYVWVDALTTYLTGIGFPDREGDFARFWPANLHLIGKDIVRFHTVYWPAFLKSAGLPAPKAVFGHGFLLHRGEKMSKSLGNVVDPLELAERFGVDQLRYFLLREVSFGQDGSYSAEAIVTRCNAELANSFGNLAQRTLAFIAKNLEGALPAAGQAESADAELLATVAEPTATRRIVAISQPRKSGDIADWLSSSPMYLLTPLSTSTCFRPPAPAMISITIVRLEIECVSDAMMSVIVRPRLTPSV
jgi:methionyl-tRNA synthetase